MACIGVGARGRRNLGVFLDQPDTQVLAVADVDKLHAEAAKEQVNARYGGQDCRVYYDFRELLARPDLDAVVLALPDHWHAIPAIQAARAGLDVYAEPPLAHTHAAGRAICQAVKRYGRIWQTGNTQRSHPQFRAAVDLVRSGRLGTVQRVEVGLPEGHTDYAGTAGQEAPSPVPSRLDYPFWLGPAPFAPYCPARVHQNWRWHLDYGGGQLMDWVGHHVDVAHWGMGWDLTGPIGIEAVGERAGSGLWNAPTRFRITAEYRGGVTVVIAGGHADIRGGVRWMGDRGWLRVDREGIDAEPRGLLAGLSGPPDAGQPPTTHHREFLDSVKSRRATSSGAEVAQRSAAVGHLALIAMRLGRRLRWNPDAEEFVNDPTATRWLGEALREPWRLG